jgi:hypothetical protein
LLNELEAQLGSSFKKIKAAIYKNLKNGFYVYAKPNKCKPDKVIKYIGRYLGRPVIATSRIDGYDGETVAFHYHRHEDNKLVIENIPALEFIERLTQHIPEKHFKMIRYYGIYARHRKSDEKILRAIAGEKHKILLSFNRWRDLTILSFGYDPLTCPKCNNSMVFLELYFNRRRVSLEELYKEAIKKSHGCRSPSAA